MPPFLAPIHDYVEEQKKKDKSYVPDKDPAVKPYTQASRQVGTKLLGLGLGAATVVASVASLIPAFFGNIITSDTTVQAAAKPLAKYLWLGAFFWAPVAVSEGILLARRELGFLAATYLASTAMLPPALLRIKLSGSGSVAQVWSLFFYFQLFRTAAFMFRIWGGPVWHFLTNHGGKEVVST